MSFDSQGRRTEYKSVTNGAQNMWLCFLYDSQGRRFEKKLTVAGITTLHHRYIYRGYLQIAALDLTRSAHPALWFVTWDPSQPIATRTLAIQKDGNWFTYGYDLTKNSCEVFGPAGYIRTAYSCAPFGAVSAFGDVTQPFQWSSEVYDSELDLVYYNFRHYSPSLGRFLSRDPIEEQGGWNLYLIGGNNLLERTDILGESFLSFTLKAGAKAASKGILKNFINSQIKTKIERIALKNYVKRFSKEADDLIDILDDPWWVTCIGFIPVVGDAFDLVNVPLQIKRAINKADNLQNRVERIISIQGKKASSLLHAKFKHLIGDDPLTEKTYVELKSIAIGESSMSKRARTIIKLIDQAHRLNKKI